MADARTDGQARAAALSPQADAARLLARAARALVEEGSVSTDGLLPAYRALDPVGHEGARKDAVDLAFVQRCRALGGDALLRAKAIVVEGGAMRAAPRVAPGAERDSVALVAPADDDAPGNALALALGLALESKKLAHGLVPPADAVRQAFATPADARACIDALTHGGGERQVALSSATQKRRVDVDLAALAKDRPVYVLCGQGAFRAHDLLSPYARRLRAEIRAAQGSSPGGGAADDDGLYPTVDALAADEGAHEERLDVEKTDGFTIAGAGCIAVRCEQLGESDVDKRVREAAQQLKRARALLLLVEGAAALDLVLGESCRVVACVTEATGACTPAFVAERASGCVTAIANSFDGDELLTTLPSFGLRGRAGADAASAGCEDASAFPLVQAFLRAQAAGRLDAAVRLAVRAVPLGDAPALSAACIDVLSRLGPKPAPARVRR